MDIQHVKKNRSLSTNISYKQIQNSFRVPNFLEVQLYLNIKVYKWHIQELVVSTASASFNIFLWIAIPAQLWLFPLDIQWVIRLAKGEGAAKGLIINLCHMHTQTHTHRPKVATINQCKGVALNCKHVILFYTSQKNIPQIGNAHLMKHA